VHVRTAIIIGGNGVFKINTNHTISVPASYSKNGSLSDLRQLLSEPFSNNPQVALLLITLGLHSARKDHPEFVDDMTKTRMDGVGFAEHSDSLSYSISKILPEAESWVSPAQELQKLVFLGHENVISTGHLSELIDMLLSMLDD
jgi:hypothetical protein